MKDTQYRDWFDRHNILSRFAGFVIIIVFIITFYVGLFIDRDIQSDLIFYASLGVLVVYGGVTLLTNNIDKINNIIKRRG